MCESSYLFTLAYDGLSGRRVRLRPKNSRRSALVPAVALPEGSLAPSYRWGEFTYRGGGRGEDQRFQRLNLCLEDVNLSRKKERRHRFRASISFHSQRLKSIKFDKSASNSNLTQAQTQKAHLWVFSVVTLPRASFSCFSAFACLTLASLTILWASWKTQTHNI